MSQEIVASKLTITDDQSRPRAELGMTEDGHVRLALLDQDGLAKVSLMVTNDGRGFLSIVGRAEGYQAFLGELGTAQLSLHFHGDASVFVCDKDANLVEKLVDVNGGRRQLRARP